MMGNFFLGMWIVGSVFLSLIFTIGDWRLYDGIKERCERHGYIQDRDTRILCQVEKQ